MTSSRRLLLALLLVAGSGLLACAGKPIDPLAEDRARLLALEDEPLPEDWRSEATVFIGEALLAGQLQAALDDASIEIAAHPGFETPLGLARVTPRARVADVRMAPSSSCDSCVEVSADVTGILDGALQGPLGALRREVPFTASATSTLELALVEDDEGNRRALLRPVEGGAWAASAEVLDLPPALNLALSDLLRAQVEHLVTAGFVPEMPLVSLPREGPVRLRGMRARPVAFAEDQHGVAVELAFVVLERGQVLAPAPAKDGFVVVVPAETVRGLARAAALRMEPQDGHVAEPLSVVVEDDRFSVDVRVWKIAPEPVPRDFRAVGRIAVEGGVMSATTERVTALGDAPLLDPLELLVRAAIERGLEQGLAAMIPARREEALVLGRKLAIEVTKVEGRDGNVVVTGRVVLVRPADT